MEGTAGQAKDRAGGNEKQFVFAGITVRQGNGVADDMMEGRTRAGRRVRQRAEESDW